MSRRPAASAAPPLEARLRGPRHVAAGQLATCRRSERNAMEPFYPLRALVCEQCFLVQLEEFETPERDLRRLRVLLVVLDELARALRAATPSDDRALRARRVDSQVVEVACNDGYLLQYFVERGIPVLGVEPAANVAEVARREGHPDPGRVLRRARRRDALRRASRRPTCWSATTCSPTCRTSTTSSPAMKILLAPDGVHHDRVPAPAAADRGQPVRHDLPRALLVLLAHDGRAGLRRARPAAVRRRGAADARRLAAHLRLPRRRRRDRGDRARAPSCSSARRRAGYGDARDLHRPTAQRVRRGQARRSSSS